jgi:hypothetical protein
MTTSRGAAEPGSPLSPPLRAREIDTAAESLAGDFRAGAAVVMVGIGVAAVLVALSRTTIRFVRGRRSAALPPFWSALRKRAFVTTVPHQRVAFGSAPSPSGDA